MAKLNCWEIRECGRGPGESDETCPAAAERRLDEENHGRNAGRACWAVAGTYCRGEVQGTFASKLGDCMQCDFYKQVKREEGADYVSSPTLVRKLRDTE